MLYTVEDLKHYFIFHERAVCPYTPYEGRYLSDVYENFSSAKAKAFDRCEKLCKFFDGYCPGISTHNSFTFTYVFRLEHPETGEELQAIITPKYNHLYYR